MAWIYHQRTGHLERGKAKVSRGYSGCSVGRNNPHYESCHNLGCIPKGRYSIGKAADSPNVGPYALPLTPVGHRAYGRTLFRIHGDNKNHDASTGCIILPRFIRERITNSWDLKLEVVE